MDLQFDFYNLEKFVDNLEKRIEENGESALTKACEFVEGEAKMRAPKGRTGDLARSIQSKVENVDGNLEGTIFTPLEYAPYVEFGTGIHAANGNGRQDVPWAYEDEVTGELIWTAGQHPKPYLNPALDDNREEVIRILKEGLLK